MSKINVLTQKYLIILGVLFLVSCGAEDKKKGDEYGKSNNVNYESYSKRSESEKEQIGPLKGNQVASVGNEVLTVEELEQRMQAMKKYMPEHKMLPDDAKKLVVNDWISQKVLLLDAKTRGIEDEKEIRLQLENAKSSIILKKVTEDLAETIIPATEGEAKQLYEQYKDRFKKPVDFRVSEIVISTQVIADQIRSRLLNGEDFVTIAKAESIVNTASKGGDLGVIQVAPFEKMQETLQRLDIDGISEVIKGPKGFYIIKLVGKTGGEIIPFEELKDRLIQQKTFEKQRNALMKYIENVKSEYKIQKKY